MLIKLRVTSGKNAGREIGVPGERFIIGRGEGCHLQPSSDLVSRRHCEIVVGHDRVFVTDLGSSNGTRVNGKRIKATCSLVSGDQLQVGTLLFEVVIAAAVPAADPGVTAEHVISHESSNAKRQGSESEIIDWLTGGAAAVPAASTVEMMLDETHAEPRVPSFPPSGLTVADIKQTTPSSGRTMRLPAVPEPSEPAEIKDASDAASAVIGNIRQTLEKNKRRH